MNSILDDRKQPDPIPQGIMSLVDSSDRDGFIIESFQGALIAELQLKGFPDSEIAAFITHSSRFNKLVKNFQNDYIWLGDHIELPESYKADGSVRDDEAGSQVLLEGLKINNIDTSKVLVFRRTTPSQAKPKPEIYWTSSLVQARIGHFGVEIPWESILKDGTVILVSNLAQVAEVGNGLIKDKDSSPDGVAVRQIQVNNFNQSEVIGQLELVMPNPNYIAPQQSKEPWRPRF